jgi:hypothetical protein
VTKERYILRLSGLPTQSGAISGRLLARWLTSLTACTQRVSRLLVDGTSVQTGTTPAWLERAADFEVVAQGKGSTTLTLEAPHFSSLDIPEFTQSDFFASGPSPEDTSLSCLARALDEVLHGNAESDFAEPGVLDAVHDLRKLFSSENMRAELSRDGVKTPLVAFGRGEVERVSEMRRTLPQAQEAFISGKLDGLRHTARRFFLELPDSREVRGQLHPEFLAPDDLAPFFGKNVTLRGEAHFRPSGALRLFIARTVKARAEGEEVFATTPVMQTEAAFVGDIRKESKVKAGWASGVWGQWPGEESIDELLKT